MPRPRKPTRLLELNGSFQHDPKRAKARQNEPKPNGDLGEPPDCLSKTQRAIWSELASQVPDGVLTNADRILVELSVRLIAKMRSGKALASDTSLLQVCLGRMGLTPADRSRLQVEPIAPSADPFQSFMDELMETPSGEDEPAEVQSGNLHR